MFLSESAPWSVPTLDRTRRDVDNEWENRAMYSRAGAAVGCVRAAVPPRPAVAAYSGYRRGRRLRAGRSAATVDGGCRHLPTRSPTPCQRLTSRSYLGRIDHWHARLASGPLQLVPLGATTPRGHSNSYPSEYPSGPTDLVSLRVCPVVSSNT